MASLKTKVGTFTANTVTGNQSVTGVGFQPKLVIFMSSDISVFGTPAVHDEPIFGIAVSAAQQWAISCISQDAQATTNTFRSAHNDRCYYADAFVGVSIEMDFVSQDADGFTVNILDASPATVQVGYIAIGGDDIQVSAGVTGIPTAGATHAVTGAGFQPDVVLLGHIGEVNWPVTNSTNFIFGVGAMTATDQVAFALADRDAVADAQTNTYQRSDSCIVECFNDTELTRCNRLSLDADGFTLNVPKPPTAATITVGWVAIKGFPIKVGVETQPTAPGTKATTGVGFRPQTVVFMGARQTATTAVVNGDAFHALGGTDGTDQFQMMGGSEDAVGTSDSARLGKNTISMGWCDGSGAIVTEADLQSLDGDGFTLNWTTADAIASQFIYWAFQSGDPDPVTAMVPHLSTWTVA